MSNGGHVEASLSSRHGSCTAGGVGHGRGKRFDGKRGDGAPELDPLTIVLGFNDDLQLGHDAVELGNTFVPKYDFYRDPFDLGLGRQRVQGKLHS